MDAQGVSRDEAMASGLVPVTSGVTAVPEFVDQECGFLVPLDDAVGLAAAIETLYHDPARFERMSAAAAARVRKQSGPDLTAGRELELLGEPLR
jgi:glycosyltransferase involved in cell wall biosynthesis